MKIGIVELFKSKKGTLSLVILLLATLAVMTKHIDGVSFAAIIATIGTIYNFVQHKIDIAQTSNNSLPPKGQL